MLFSFNSSSQTVRDTLKVGVHQEPPFIIQSSDGNLQGLSIDLWDRIAGEMKVPYKYVEFSDVISIVRALDYNELDISINPLTNSPARIEKFQVSQPFYVSSVGWL